MAQSMIGPTTWIRLLVFSVLVIALAAVPVRGCMRSDATLENASSAARNLPADTE